MSRVTHTSHRRTIVTSTFAVLFVIATLPLISTTASAQQVPTVLFTAGAYGTTAFIGSTVTVGKTAPVGVGPGCGTAQVGAHTTGTVASLNASPLVNTGTVNTSAASATGMATASADVLNLSMLNGLITAQEVKAVSTTSIDSQGNLSSSAAGSTFVNLVVAGNVFNGLPAPNTTISLAGFGKVVLNEQVFGHRTGFAGLNLSMIHVYITQTNLFNIKIGTQAIVSYATSGITVVSGPGAVDGSSYGTSVSSQLVNSSPTAPISVGCGGTGGNTITNSLTTVNVPNILTTGTVVDTGKANVTPTAVNSQTTATIQTINLLGLITANVIQAQADASTPDGVNFTFSSSGTFTNISVAGHPEITDSVAPNTKITLANLGVLYLHRVIQTKNDISVIMIELSVNHANQFNLPIGADIKIGVAEASLHSITHP